MASRSTFVTIGKACSTNKFLDIKRSNYCEFRRHACDHLSRNSWNNQISVGISEICGLICKLVIFIFPVNNFEILRRTKIGHYCYKEILTNKIVEMKDEKSAGPLVHFKWRYHVGGEAWNQFPL